MLKAETLRDIACTLGKDNFIKVGDDEVRSKKFSTGITRAQRKVLKEQFMELEKAGKLVATGEHDYDNCMLWRGHDMEYSRIVISLFRDSVIISCILKYSSE